MSLGVVRNLWPSGDDVADDGDDDGDDGDDDGGGDGDDELSVRWVGGNRILGGPSVAAL